MIKQPSLFLVIITAVLAVSCTPGTQKPESTSEPSAVLIEPTNTPKIPSGVKVESATANAQEPVMIRGLIPYTSPFFLDTVAEAFVLLEDQAGFYQKDLEYAFPLTSQMIGPIEIDEDDIRQYELGEDLLASPRTGGRFRVWVEDDHFEAEYTIYGSGVPIVLSERGTLVPEE